MKWVQKRQQRLPRPCGVLHMTSYAMHGRQGQHVLSMRSKNRGPIYHEFNHASSDKCVKIPKREQVPDERWVTPLRLRARPHLSDEKFTTKKKEKIIM